MEDAYNKTDSTILWYSWNLILEGVVQGIVLFNLGKDFRALKIL